MDKKNKKLTYLVIGIISLIVAVLGATFAYFTATASNNNTIAGNMATVTFDLSVTKKTNVDDVKGGLIPMTNSMVQSAISNASNKGICVDNNGNAVCQIYKITVNNNGSASLFVDGYVTLTGGSGTPTDYTTSPTTMRWSQAFCTESNDTLSSCTTSGTSTARQTNNISWNALGTGTGHSTTEIKDSYNSIKGTGTISGNNYDVINTNYIRVSKHSSTTYSRDNDVTSALVFNQFLSAYDNTNNDTGDSSGTYVDSQVYYIAVWLSENGHNQTAGSGGVNVPNSTDDFFEGNVTFISAEGSEVTATFSGYTRVGGESGQSQTSSSTYYTVNIPDDEDNLTTTNPKLVWIDNPIPSGVTKYTTVSAARSAFSNRPFYLKHTLENDIVTESYVEFIVTPEMASANVGMQAGTYTLRGVNMYEYDTGEDDWFCKSEYIDPNTGDCRTSAYYTSNVNVLKQAFGESSGYCSDFTSSSDVDCYVSGLGAGANSNGNVGASDDSANCNVGGDGSSGCLIWYS